MKPSCQSSIYFSSFFLFQHCNLLLCAYIKQELVRGGGSTSQLGFLPVRPGTFYTLYLVTRPGAKLLVIVTKKRGKERNHCCCCRQRVSHTFMIHCARTHTLPETSHSEQQSLDGICSNIYAYSWLVLLSVGHVLDKQFTTLLRRQRTTFKLRVFDEIFYQVVSSYLPRVSLWCKFDFGTPSSRGFGNPADPFQGVVRVNLF